MTQPGAPGEESLLSIDGGYARRAARGLLTTGSTQVLRILLQIGSVLILARLLTPNDYGLVAMVLVLIGVAELFRDLGLSTSALSVKNLSTSQRDNLFWLNSSIGAGLTVLVAALAPGVAMLYGREELVAITLALAPSYVLSGLATQHRVDLLRSLRFAVVAWIDIAALVLSLVVGVVLATAGAGYWALVAQQMVGGILVVPCLFVAAGWLPGKFRRGQGTRALVRRGLEFFVSGLMTYGLFNVDTFVVGHQVGAAQLGWYTRSLQLVRTPLRQLQAPLGSVVLPILVRLQDDDDRFMSGVRRCQLGYTYPLLLLISVFVAGAQDIVPLALGDQWSGTAPVMVLVAATAGVVASSTPASWIVVSRGLSRQLVGVTAINLTLTTTGVLVGSIWGVLGIASGCLVAAVVMWPLTFVLIGRLARLDTHPLMVAAAQPLALTLVGITVARCVRSVYDGQPGLVGLLVVLGSIAAVMLLALTIPVVRRDAAGIRQLVGMVRR